MNGRLRAPVFSKANSHAIGQVDLAMTLQCFIKAL